MEAVALEKTEQTIKLVSLSDPAIDKERLKQPVIDAWVSSFDMSVLPLTNGTPVVYEARALSRTELDNILLAAFAKRWEGLDEEEAKDASIAWANVRVFDVAVRCPGEPPNVFVRKELGSYAWQYSTLRPTSPAQQ